MGKGWKFRAGRRLLAGVSAGCLWAATEGPALAAGAPLIERIVVTASYLDAWDTPGSVQYIAPEDLDRFDYGDIHRVLRLAPGVYLQEEEGYGLRPNIGLRGSGTDRSSRIALMEDGILVAPAPYAAPSAYYFPSTPRIHAVEVSKGPAAIKYGPLTTGGAINLFSTPIPGTPGGFLSAQAGSFSSYRVHAYAGGFTSIEGGWEIGGLAEGLWDETGGFKELDGGGDTGYRIADGVLKLALRTPSDVELPQALEFKLQRSNQDSDETYLGLTLADFAADPYRRYRASRLDHLDVDHRLYQLTHRVDLSGNIDVTTTAYYTETDRAWYKLNDVRNGGTSYVALNAVLADPAAYPTAYANLAGAAGYVGANDALRVRNNNRTYYAQGIQSVLALDFATGGIAHGLEFSARYHEDEEDRFQNDDRYRMDNGRLVLTTAGAPGTQDNRIGSASAWAFYLRDEMEIGNVTVTPGLRHERIELTQKNYGTGDPARTGANLTVRGQALEVWLPGIAAMWDVDGDWSLFAGVHRGFSNPAPGSTADAETSTNWEAGARFAQGGLSAEAIAFFSDYDNLVGTCTASTGGGCTIGDQFDGGAVHVYGLEAVARWDLGAAIGLGVALPLHAVYTITGTSFRSSFTSAYGPWGTVAKGDELPYLPRHQWTFGAGVAGEGWRADVLINHAGEARETAGSGPVPASERIDARTLVDVAGAVDLADGLRLKGSVENLFDEVYNAGFSPAGARPGKPRAFWIGIESTF